MRVTSRTSVRISNATVAASSEPGDRVVAGVGDESSSVAAAATATPPRVRVGGLGDEMASLRELLTLQPVWPAQLPRPSGVLLHGPSGAGKTTLVRAVAAQAGAIFAYIHGPELHSPHPGEAERALRRKFTELQQRVISARSAGVGIAVGLLFIDEIDALCPKRSDGASASSSANPEARLVATLLTLMDGVDNKSTAESGARGKFYARPTNANVIDACLSHLANRLRCC